MLAGLLGAWPVQRAAASCVGPVLAVGPVPEEGTAPAPAVLDIGPVTTVAGEWFRTGCDDTGQGSGCGAPESEESPMRGVDLVLEQGTVSALLATSDAADRQDRYAIRWRVQVPSTFRPGPATLTAAGTSLSVQLRTA